MKKSITIKSILNKIIEDLFIIKNNNCRVVISSYHRLLKSRKYKLDFKLYNDSIPFVFPFKGSIYYIYSDFPDKIEDKNSEEINKVFDEYNHIIYKIDNMSSFRIDYKIIKKVEEENK